MYTEFKTKSNSCEKEIVKTWRNMHLYIDNILQNRATYMYYRVLLGICEFFFISRVAKFAKIEKTSNFIYLRQLYFLIQKVSYSKIFRITFLRIKYFKM